MSVLLAAGGLWAVTPDSGHNLQPVFRQPAMLLFYCFMDLSTHLLYRSGRV